MQYIYWEIIDNERRELCLCTHPSRKIAVKPKVQFVKCAMICRRTGIDGMETREAAGTDVCERQRTHARYVRKTRLPHTLWMSISLVLRASDQKKFGCAHTWLNQSWFARLRRLIDWARVTLNSNTRTEHARTDEGWGGVHSVLSAELYLHKV